MGKGHSARLVFWFQHWALVCWLEKCCLKLFSLRLNSSLNGLKHVLTSRESLLGLVISFRWCRTVNPDTIHGVSKSIFLFSVHNLIETAISEEVAMLAPVWLPSTERQVDAQSEKYLKLLGHFLCLMLDSFHVTFRLWRSDLFLTLSAWPLAQAKQTRSAVSLVGLLSLAHFTQMKGKPPTMSKYNLKHRLLKHWSTILKKRCLMLTGSLALTLVLPCCLTLASTFL